MIPDAIGPFRIVRELGRGSTGVVYEATQELPRRRVALKVLRAGEPELAGRSRFEREAAALARLRHPGIATLFEAGIAELASGPTPWFAMELVPGLPLDEHIRAPNVGRERRLRLFVEVCAAVEAAHEAGVIHRDLKPANVLVEDSGRARIVDFGIAHLTDRDAAGGSTTVGGLLGTLAYMSPEQARGESAAVDARADVYSLGVILYEMLAGRLPCETDHRPVASALRAIAESEPTPLGQLDASLRGDLENIARKALEKDPARRYASAGELGEDVARHLDHRPIAARAPGTIERATKFARRHRALVGATTIAGLAIVAAIAALAIGLAKARVALDASDAIRLAMLELVMAQVGVVADLDNVSGSDGARREILEDALALAARVRLADGAAAHDPRSMRTLAALLKAEGDLLVREHRFVEAEPLRARHFELRRELLALAPADPQLRREVSIAQVLVGDLAKERRQYAEARRIYLDSLAIDEALVAAQPTERQYRSDLAHSYLRLGVVEERLRRVMPALLWFEKHLATSEELLRRFPANRDARSNVATAHSTLAGLLRATPRWREAAGHAEEAVRRLREMWTESPNSADVGNLLVVALLSQSTSAGEAGDFDCVQALQSEAERVAAQLRAENPERPALHETLLECRCAMAGTAIVGGRLDEASAIVEPLCTETLAMAEAPGASFTSQDRAARVLRARAQIAMKRGELDAATRDDAAALRWIERLHAQAPAEGAVLLARFCLEAEVPSLRDDPRGLELARAHVREHPGDSRWWIETIAEGRRAAGDVAMAAALEELR